MLFLIMSIIFKFYWFSFIFYCQNIGNLLLNIKLYYYLINRKNALNKLNIFYVMLVKPEIYIDMVFDIVT